MPVASTKTGTVGVRDFDLGVVKKLDVFEQHGRYWASVPGVTAPTFPPKWEDESLVGQEMPGVPVVFAQPSDRVAFFVLPMILVRREDFSLSLERWPSMYLAYRAPSDNATPITVQWGSKTYSGWSEYEVLPGPFPYDITYTISVVADGPAAETTAQRLLDYVMRRFKPRADYVEVVDSIGQTRRYELTAEGPASLREVLDVLDRQTGFSLSLMVVGEIDQDDPVLQTPVRELSIEASIKE